MRANTKITFEMFDTDSKLKSTPSCGQCQTDISSLKNEKSDTSNYATTETDGFYLDGNYKFLDDVLPTGLYSNVMSDDNGVLNTAVVLNISFSTAVTSNGITLYFPKDEYPTRVNIKWLSDDYVIKEAEYNPDKTVFFCRGKAENYNRLVLTFNGTKKPEHFIKLRGINYGQALMFGPDKIIKSNVVQEINLLCDEIAINTLEFTIEDKDKLFSAVNSEGVFFAVQENQTISVDTTIGNKETHIGTFYLQNITSGGVTAQFRAQDAIGLIDEDEDVQDTYFDTDFETFCAQMLDGYKYTIDESLKKKTVRGYLTSCSKREALQQACFAVGAVVDTQFSNEIKIYPLTTRPSQLLKSSQIFAKGKVENIKPHKYVNVTVHKYDASGIDAPSVITGQLNPKAKGSVSVTEAVFVNEENAQNVMDRLLRYYDNRVKYKFSLPLDNRLRLGDMLMTYLESSYIKGSLSQISINLSGGLIADVVIEGDIFDITNNTYVGEVYSGERGVV